MTTSCEICAAPCTFEGSFDFVVGIGIVGPLCGRCFWWVFDVVDRMGVMDVGNGSEKFPIRPEGTKVDVPKVLPLKGLGRHFDCDCIECLPPSY